MAQITFRLSDELLSEIDDYIDESAYSNRSDFFRDLSRRELRDD